MTGCDLVRDRTGSALGNMYWKVMTTLAPTPIRTSNPRGDPSTSLWISKLQVAIVATDLILNNRLKTLASPRTPISNFSLSPIIYPSYLIPAQALLSSSAVPAVNSTVIFFIFEEAAHNPNLQSPAHQASVISSFISSSVRPSRLQTKQSAAPSLATDLVSCLDTMGTFTFKWSVSDSSQILCAIGHPPDSSLAEEYVLDMWMHGSRNVTASRICTCCTGLDCACSSALRSPRRLSASWLSTKRR
jgi:hypothetical protein